MKSLAETCVSSEVLYCGKIVTLRKDRVQLPNGKESTREVIAHPGAVAVLGVTTEGRVVLVQQYRYPVGQTLLELPAGKLEKGEDPEAAAIRELSEETGYQARNLRKLYTFYTTPGFTDEVMHLYLATGLTQGDSHPDEDEFVYCHDFSREELERKMQEGAIVDGKTLIGLLYYLQHVAL